MSALALRAGTGGRADLARWGASFAVILGLHAAALMSARALRPPASEPGEALPAVLIDMAPPPSAPIVEPSEVPPSEEAPEVAIPDPVVDAPPDTPEPDVPPPEPQPIVTAEVPPPDPLPDVPPLEATLKPPPVVPPKAEVTLPVREPRPAPPPVKPRPKVVERQPPKPAEARRAERQEARRPPAQAAGARTTSALPSASSGASVASRSSWQGALVAHLRRNLRSQGGETGSAAVRFSVDRGGRVLSANLVSSAGSSALDAEAVAVFRRAQPLPSPPPDVPGGSFTFTIPIRFTAR